MGKTRKELLIEFMGEKIALFNPAKDYETNWNHLMPVVEKIENSKYVDEFIMKSCSVFGHTAEINSALKDFSFRIDTTGRTRIEATYKAVVKFIQWYNEKHL